jgi:hypothetical protein
MAEEKRCKVGFCSCGIRISLAAITPDADTDDDIIAQFKEFANKGRKIDYMDIDEMKVLFGGCFNGKCFKQQSLFEPATEQPCNKH